MTKQSVEKAVVAGIILLGASALWVESDLYRYVWGAACLGALVYYLRFDISDTNRIRIGWVGIACLFWAGYVAVRYLLAAIDAQSPVVGDAEEIYLFALFYPTTGYAVYLMRNRLDWLLPAFVVVSTILLVAAFDLRLLDPPFPPEVMFTNNPIHASLMCAMLSIIHCGIIAHLLYDQQRVRRHVLIALSAFNAVLCLFYILFLNSKGIWLAMAIVLVCAAIAIGIAMRHSLSRLQISATILTVVLAGGAVAMLAQERIVGVAGSSATAAARLLTGSAKSLDPVAQLTRSAEDPATPASMAIRLKITVDAIDMAEEKPILGWGPAWKKRWEERQYHDHEFYLLHSGLLEVLVRHGVFGLGFYLFILCWALREIQLASRAGLISQAAPGTAAALLVLFVVALATNSHNRLAIGESFMWLFVASGFYAFFLRQSAGLVRSGTPI